MLPERPGRVDGRVVIYHNPDTGNFGNLDNLNGLAETVQQSVEALARYYPYDFDSLWVTGMSGVIVGVPVALALGCHLVIVRKKGEVCHSHEGSINAEGCTTRGDRGCFLDDFISSGATRRKVQLEAEQHGVRLVADYLYRDNVWDERTPFVLRARDSAVYRSYRSGSENEYPADLPF